MKFLSKISCLSCFLISFSCFADNPFPIDGNSHFIQPYQTIGFSPQIEPSSPSQQIRSFECVLKDCGVHSPFFTVTTDNFIPDPGSASDGTQAVNNPNTTLDFSGKWVGPSGVVFYFTMDSQQVANDVIAIKCQYKD